MIKLIQGDCLEVMAGIDAESIDLTVTSPPYDNLRTYKGYTFDYEKTIDGLYRITKPGGVVVWVVADATIKGSETGTSFRQALHAMKAGFNLHDTMIWNKNASGFIGALNRYESHFEYMFIFSKGKPGKVNIIKDKKNKEAGKKIHSKVRTRDGKSMKTACFGELVAEYGRRGNVWKIQVANQKEDRNGHPAPFPYALASDHILSWSNPGDLVFDPFLGSGTTGKAAIDLGRHFIGCDISAEYVEIAQKRIAEAENQKTLDGF